LKVHLKGFAMTIDAELSHASYDPEAQRFGFTLSGSVDGEPLSLFGNIYLQKPAETPEEALGAAYKRELAAVLRSLADRL
jgi:hypothetical protein